MDCRQTTKSISAIALQSKLFLFLVVESSSKNIDVLLVYGMKFKLRAVIAIEKKVTVAGTTNLLR